MLMSPGGVKEFLQCASRGAGRPVRPPLTPIPVHGPFDRVGVNVLQLPRTRSGNKYVIVFIDYLTKWPEAFATADQTAPTIAKVVCGADSGSARRPEPVAV